MISMGTQILADSILHKIEGREIIVEKYADKDSEQGVLSAQCVGVEDYSCHINPVHDYINAIHYKDYGDVMECSIDCTGISFITKRVVVAKQPWSIVVQQLTSGGEYYGR